LSNTSFHYIIIFLCSKVENYKETFRGVINTLSARGVSVSRQLVMSSLTNTGSINIAACALQIIHRVSWQSFVGQITTAVAAASVGHGAKGAANLIHINVCDDWLRGCWDGVRKAELLPDKHTHTHARRQILGLRETWSRGRTFHFNSGCQNRPHVATHKMGNRFSSPSHFRRQLSFSGVVAKKTNNCKSRVYKTELIQESGKT